MTKRGPEVILDLGVNFLIASVLSAALHGVDAFGVEVEVHIGNGTQPNVKTVGLAAGAVKESQERVKPAVTNSGFHFPNRTITINLAPADMRKDGSAFDLPIALSLLGATGRLTSRERLRRYLVIGELALDGRVRGIKGPFPPRCMRARQSMTA